MGLAASQARFLGITARKTSCELKSMQIAQDKLSITNQLSKITEEYQNSLDATKLVWDSESDVDGTVYDVNYELLMQPSLLNEYSPQLLTNRRNQIVLNSRYANVMREAFPGAQAGAIERNDTNFKLFIDTMYAKGLINQEKYDKLTANAPQQVGETSAVTSYAQKYYRNDNGLGGEVQEKFTANAMKLSTLSDYVEALTDPNQVYLKELQEKYGTSNDPENPTIYDKAKNLADLVAFKGIQYYSGSTEQYATGLNNFIDAAFTEDGESRLSLSVTKDPITFADLLTENITLTSDHEYDKDVPGRFVKEMLNHMYKIMTNFLNVDVNDSKDKSALNYAFSQICELQGLKWDSTNNLVVDYDNSNVVNPNVHVSTMDNSKATNHNGFYSDGDEISISLSNMTKSLLTYFQKAVDGYNSGYSVETSGEYQAGNSFYVTKNPNYYFITSNPEALGVEDETFLLIDYYSQLFNNIALNGWTENNLVDEPDSLKQMLKNGTLFTSTISSDGNFYQGPYTSNNFIAEVTDEDAITKAEANFKIQQAKLNAKEEELNVDMQLVDAELSALNTEYETVKNMISKAIQKGFNTLSNG